METTKWAPEKITIGWIDPGYVIGEFATSIAKQARDMEYFGCMDQIARHSSSLPLRSKNQMVQSWLEGTDSPWLWMVDADMVFDEGHVMKLWECANEHDAKIVSGLAFIFKHSGKPAPSFFVWGDQAGEKWDERDLVSAHNWVPDEPIEIAASGLASVLVHRDVFEALEADFHESYRWFHTYKLNHKGDPYGEDLQFFVRTQELGFKHMLEPRARTWHGKIIGVGYDDWARAWGKDVDGSAEGPH